MRKETIKLTQLSNAKLVEMFESANTAPKIKAKVSKELQKRNRK